VDFWADFEQRIIDRAINEWQHDRWAVSMPKDNSQTRVVTYDTAKHSVSDRNTVCLKDVFFPFV